METGRLPEEEDLSALVEKLSAVSGQGLRAGTEQGLRVIDFQVRASSTHVCKMFLTEHQDLRQSYVFGEGISSSLCYSDKKQSWPSPFELI